VHGNQVVEFSRNKTHTEKYRIGVNQTEIPNISIEDNALIIINITKDDMAYHYKCENKYTATSRYFNVHPYIIPLEKLEYSITEGVFFEVECKTVDHNEYINSSHFKWEWNKIDLDNELFVIINTTHNQKYKPLSNGKFYIKNTVADDQGGYKCIVSNNNGIDFFTFKLTIRGKLSILWPFIGVSIQVLLTCVAIILWEKKSMRKRSSNKYDVGAANKFIQSESFKSRPSVVEA
jgi:hypothetical protein